LTRSPSNSRIAVGIAASFRPSPPLPSTKPVAHPARMVIEERMESPPPVALSIAGSDCSAGAGIQADLKTFQHFGVHGLTAVTCVVSETAEIVRQVHPVPVDLVRNQVSLMLDSFPITAIKTGMLFSAQHVAAVAELLKNRPGILLVVDPVMIASTGAPLIEDEAITIYREALLPLATLITPNLPEAETLLGRKIAAGDLEQAAIDLARRFQTAVLLKGGHLDGPECVDLLAENDGRLTRFTAPRIAARASHGTGCTLSAAIAASLAGGDPLPAAVARAKDYLGETLRRSYGFPNPSGGSLGALNQGTTWSRSV